MNDLTSKYKRNEAGANLAFLINEWNKWRILALQGGTRSGKTYAIIEFIIYLCETYQGLVISIVRETLPSLRASVLRDWKDIMTNLGYWSDYNFNKTEFEYRFNGNLIEFFSVDNEQRVRGRKRHICWPNEANEISKEKMMQLLLRTEAFMILDYNPSMEDSYIYDEVLQRDDCSLMVTDYTDNKFLGREIIQEIERLKETDPEAWKIYGMGQRGEGRMGIIFPKWSSCTTLPDLPFWYGVDFGFTNDPTAVIRIYYDRNQKTLYFKEVAYEKGLLNSDIIRIIKQDIRSITTTIYDAEVKVTYSNGEIIIDNKVFKLEDWIDNNTILHEDLKALSAAVITDINNQLLKFEKFRVPIYCDSAEPKSIQEFRANGLSAYPCLKGKDSVASQIQFLYNYRCLYQGENIDKEKKAYKWKDKDKNTGLKNDPIDANNHAMDAIRYGAYTHLLKSGYGYI